MYPAYIPSQQDAKLPLRRPSDGPRPSCQHYATVPARRARGTVLEATGGGNGPPT